MASDNYSHLVEINEKERRLNIYRVTGPNRHLYTSVELPNGKWADSPDVMGKFCRQLGENLILDSPQARKLLGI